jgi:hypothetical protein
MLLIPAEAYQIISSVRNTAKLGGAIAEVGTFQGASAKLIAETDSTRLIHLFDTFQGLPLPGHQDPSFTEGQFACSLEQVKASLSQYQNLRFYKGLFPDSAGPVENTRFSFVHLDVDLYQSMSDSLRFFYSRMVPGGVILCHDFSSIDAITFAVEEFFSDKPEPVIELSGNQCLIVRLGFPVSQ